MPNVTQPSVITDTAQIGDGVIVDADVNASAAIAYSKLALTNSIVNADIASSAAIADTKLAQIATASKVSGAALTSLASIPAGAGIIPGANVPAQSDKSVFVRHSANQSLTNASRVTLSFDTEDFDTDTMHDTVTNNSRITFTSAGKYYVGFAISFQGNATGLRAGIIVKNGATDVVGGTTIVGNNTSASIDTVLVGGVLLNAAATDYVHLDARQDSGGTINASSANTCFWAIRVSA